MRHHFNRCQALHSDHALRSRRRPRARLAVPLHRRTPLPELRGHARQAARHPPGAAPGTDALARWITEAGLSAETDDTPVRVTEGDLTHARTLREALYRLVRAAMAGRHPTRPMSRGPTRRRPAPTSPPSSPSRRTRATAPGSPCAGRPSVPDPRPSRPWPGTPSCSLQAAHSLPGSRSAGTPSARCSSWTTPRPVGAAGAPWTAAGNLAKVAGYRSRSRTGSSR